MLTFRGWYSDLVKLVAALSLAFLSTFAAQPPSAGKLVTVEGTVSVDGPAMPPGYLQVWLSPLNPPGESQSAEVRRDGTFTINSVFPGHWRLSVSGVYIKSVMQGVRKVSAADIEIAPQSGFPLKIVVGTKFATLKVTTSSQHPPTGQVFVVFWDDGDRQFSPVAPDGSGKLSPQGGAITVPPGRYLVCAFVGIQPWMAVAASASGRALRKALESHCQTVQAAENGVATIRAVSAPRISAEDLMRPAEKQEEELQRLQ
jgi:hypothetical protein